MISTTPEPDVLETYGQHFKRPLTMCENRACQNRMSTCSVNSFFNSGIVQTPDSDPSSFEEPAINSTLLGCKWEKLCAKYGMSCGENSKCANVSALINASVVLTAGRNNGESMCADTDQLPALLPNMVIRSLSPPNQ
ncbi:unnamed protein product [Medioppia subpectinata]|uniref:Uncharacterized protein n=1 Tax=Medioppia subpectinata TaxID=1979941 RepID=A0A7R9PZY3_9ACAR|nr:unnamed protein product [Medioppia subpectinata]CAG2106960.1 unnamed protein product [Medioppia subpectinata]